MKLNLMFSLTMHPPLVDSFFQQRKYKVEDYMESQEINVRMRTILVDWLVQVHLRFHLLQETLFLTIQLIDRYLAVSILFTHSFMNVYFFLGGGTES